MMKKRVLFSALIFSCIVLISLVSALPIIVTPLNATGDVQPNTSFTYIWNFTTNSDCTGVVYSNTSSITTDKYGRGFVNLSLSSLSTMPSYLCEYRNGSLRKTFLLEDNIFGHVFADSINVSNNVTANFYFGDGSQLTNLPSGTNILDTNSYNTSQFTEDSSQLNVNLTWLTNFINTVRNFDITDYFTKTQIESFNYYNSSVFDYNDYYLNSNPFGFYNSTTIPSYSAGSNLTLTGTTFAVNTTSLKDYFDNFYSSGSGDVTAVRPSNNLIQINNTESGDVYVQVNITELNRTFIQQDEYPNLDTDSTDDFDGTFSSLTGVVSQQCSGNNKVTNITIQEGILTIVCGSDIDTNETARFNNLTGTDCSAGDFVTGVNDLGELVCDTPSGSGDITSVRPFDKTIEINNTESGDTYVKINSTNLTNTIEALDTDTTYSNGIGLNLTNTEFSINRCADTEILKFNSTSENWECESDATGASTDTNASTACSTNEFLDGDGNCVDFSGYDQDASDDFNFTTSGIGNYSGENGTIARIGDCPSGQFVQNITTGGVECVVVTASGDGYNTTEEMQDAVGSAFNISLIYDDAGDEIGVNTTWAEEVWAILTWDYDYGDLINVPTLLSDFTDDLGNRGYTHLTNFTNDLSFVNNNSGDLYLGFRKINSTDWSNVSITESQISDLQSYLTSYTETDPLWSSNQSSYYSISEIESFNYYNSSVFDYNDYYLNSNPFGYYNSTNPPPGITDTNASTACSTNEFLDGDGNCVDFSGYDQDASDDFNFTTSGIGNYSSENSTIARIGDCPSGQFVQNTTTGGVECLTPSYYTDSDIDGSESAFDGWDKDSSDDITQTYGNTTYVLQDNEANLNVNSSGFWDDFNSVNTTQFENEGGLLHIIPSWLTSFLDSWLGTKDTDDLAQGSTNLYDNRTFNQSLTDSLYVDISGDTMTGELITTSLNSTGNVSVGGYVVNEWNGTCYNTYVGGTLIQSIGCQ